MMKSALFIVSLAGSIVLASPVHQQLHKPLHKRGVDIEYKTEFVTVVVTGSPPSSTSETGFQPHMQERPQVANVEVPQPEAVNAESAVKGTPDSQTAPAQSSSRPGPSQGDAPSFSGDYQQQVIETHNYLRSLHGAPALTWDDQLASDAKEGASKCVWDHDTVGTDAGQNMGLGHEAQDVGKFISGMYENEIGVYGNNYGQEPGFSTGYGHFTQILWESTTTVGCATVECPGGVAGKPNGNIADVLTMCNYLKAGNYPGGYAANVKAPL